MFFIRYVFPNKNSFWMKELRPGTEQSGFLVKNYVYSLIPRSKLADPGQNTSTNVF
jgi:hypothetical protein